MRQRLHFKITEIEVADIERHGFATVLLSLLADATSTLWQMDDKGMGVELMEPYRMFSLCASGREVMQVYEKTGVIQPCLIQVDFSAPVSGSDQTG